MALIEYIAKKSRGKTVLEPVILKLDSGDRIRFRSPNKNTQLVLEDPNGYLTFMVTQPLSHPVPLATAQGDTLVVGVDGDKVKKASGVAVGSALGRGLGDDTGGGLGDDTGGGLGDDTGGGLGDDTGGGSPPIPVVSKASARKTKRRAKRAVSR
jgi:hypothetical protein